MVMQWYDWFAYWIIVLSAINIGIYGASHHLQKPFDFITYLGQLTSPHLAHLIFFVKLGDMHQALQTPV